MFGAIMPEPFAKPLSRTVVPSIVAVAVAPFGKVSVVMIARAAGSQASADSFSTAPGSAAMMRSGGGGSPITPVEEMNTSLRVAAEQPRRFRRGRLDDLPAGAPGEHVGVAGIDDNSPDRAADQALPTPHDRMPRGLGQREHAGHRAARRQLGDHHVVAPAIADAGFMRGETHAGDRLQLGKRSGARGETAAIFSDSGKAGCAR